MSVNEKTKTANENTKTANEKTKSGKTEKMSKKKADKILDILKAEYPDAECALVHRNVYELIVCVVLSAQTTDVSVNKITPKLFDKYPTPQKLAKANQEDVIEIIKTIGMYKTKSANIINLGKILTEQYNGRVPCDYDALVSLPGVGRKTANVVLSVGFGQQRIAVDTHVFRVTNRIGLVHEKDVLATELALMEVLPEERWSEAHHSFIFHGRNCCTARKPHCGECPLRGLCESEERN
jgi:endonuclease-3